MAAETHYTANTGLVSITTGNTNIDGSGTLYTVLTAGADGTLIKKVFIKGTQTGSNSSNKTIVRLFVYDGSNNRLLKEVEIPEVGQDSTNPTFESTINLYYFLESGHILKAVCTDSRDYNIVAEGLDVSYYSASIREESTNYTANTGVAIIETQNSNLDGSGTLATLITGGSSSTFDGIAIESISLKATTDVTRGMIRLFIQDKSGTSAADTFLFKEIPVYPVNATGTFPSYYTLIVFPDTLQLEAEFKIVASIETSTGEKISAITNGMDYTYPI